MRWIAVCKGFVKEIYDFEVSFESHGVIYVYNLYFYEYGGKGEKDVRFFSQEELIPPEGVNIIDNDEMSKLEEERERVYNEKRDRARDHRNIRKKDEDDYLVKTNVNLKLDCLLPEVIQFILDNEDIEEVSRLIIRAILKVDYFRAENIYSQLEWLGVIYKDTYGTHLIPRIKIAEMFDKVGRIKGK